MTRPMYNLLRGIAEWRDGKPNRQRPFAFDSASIRASARLFNEGYVFEREDGPDLTEAGRKLYVSVKEGE